MPGGIFLIKGDGRLEEMTEQPYNTEDLLQRLLAEYRVLLAGDQIDPASPRRWLLVAREVAVPSEEDGPGTWSLDLLFLDQDGVATFVEVKRSANSEIRRKVVGQMLDYVAGAKLYWSVEFIRELFKETCKLGGGRQRASPW